MDLQIENTENNDIKDEFPKLNKKYVLEMYKNNISDRRQIV